VISSINSSVKKKLGQRYINDINNTNQQHQHK
jgi:hypothetical protein